MNDDLLFAHVAAQFFSTPLLIRQQEAETIGGYLRTRMLGAGPDANRFQGHEEFDAGTRRWKGYRKEGSVGVVSILGELVNRGAWLGASSGLTSYEGVTQQIRNAAADKDVRTIVLDIQSPGGQALGMNETARLIRSVSAEKKVVAVVNAMAASAAYGLASGAGEIVITESGIAGSIGVVLVHHDRSQQMHNAGIKTTVFRAGEDKAVGNPFEPLSRHDEDILQSEIERIMDGFVRLVSDHRPAMTVDAIRGLKAGIRIGEDAVKSGLADRVGSFNEVLTDLSRASGRSTVQHRRTSMDNNDKPGADAKPGISQADHEKAVTSARSEGEAAGAKAANDRITAIVVAEGMKGNSARLSAALDLAAKSPSMSAEDVVAFVTANVAEQTKMEPPKASLANRAPDPLAATDQPSSASVKSGWDAAFKGTPAH